jgi:hypothetical protein
MEELNRKINSTISSVRNRKISDSSKNKYMNEVDKIKNITYDDILNIKTAISRLDEIQHLASVEEAPPIFYDDTSSVNIIAAPVPAPIPAAPIPAAPIPAAPIIPVPGLDNEVKVLRYKFGKILVDISELANKYTPDIKEDLFITPPSLKIKRTPFLQYQTNAMVTDPTSSDYFLNKISNDKNFVHDAKSNHINTDEYLKSVEKAFKELTKIIKELVTKCDKLEEDNKELGTEVIMLRKEYSDLLIKLYNGLELDEKELPLFDDIDIKNMVSDNSNSEYIINKLKDKGIKVSSSSPPIIETKEYLDHIQGIKTRKFINLFNLFWGQIMQYYLADSLTGSWKSFLQNKLQPYAKEIFNTFNNKSILKDMNIIIKNLYNIFECITYSSADLSFSDVYIQRINEIIDHSSIYNPFSHKYLLMKNGNKFFKDIVNITIDDLCYLLNDLNYIISSYKKTNIFNTYKYNELNNKIYKLDADDKLQILGGGQINVIVFIFMFVIIGVFFLFYIMYGGSTYGRRLNGNSNGREAINTLRIN